MTKPSLKPPFSNQTHWINLAFLGTRILGTPCWSLLCMLAFILYKYAGATALQITCIIALKPASSLLSPYWSQAIYKRPDKILLNLIGANCLRYVLFLFTPWVSSGWYMIVAFGIYMTLTRATIPAWIELFKRNLPNVQREKLIGYATTIDYLGTALLSIGLGVLLDLSASSWPWLFSFSALFGLLSTLLLIPSALSPQSICQEETVKLKSEITLAQVFTKKIFTPWKQIVELLKERKDFAMFQLGFMFGGGGLMIMQPALPKFFVDILQLSFVEMGCAIALCKAVGVALTSPLWAKWFGRMNIFELSALVTLFAAIFPFLLVISFYHVSLLYVAYIFYGIMQAGSEMSWHMSGLVFAGEKDSSLFSSTNVLTVGLRGSIIPVLGAFFIPWLHSSGVILLGALFCFAATCIFFLHRHSFELVKE